jgi:hypothetical protein
MNFTAYKMTIWITSCLALTVPMFVMSAVQPKLFVFWFCTATGLFTASYLALLTGIAFDWLM